ncbi:hypothetical protein THASP1DRAFT_29799 [Thamnocephalis sphaerospora]|uniref:Uncharacterized protein n=1 Tax=Thamnocephalis sphaerospora TaxID=78915 RepID=A0A4P9XQR5_9FUNG|nr:hypothetical protein THASP1DRAFT_29799 [Thamnocephalis sphaerospora]|eukprot:RKP08394.1 hypothetical protein THASP1DRAFT_29799 [Thamnocephalis sphaerospora]
MLVTVDLRNLSPHAQQELSKWPHANLPELLGQLVELGLCAQAEKDNDRSTPPPPLRPRRGGASASDAIAPGHTAGAAWQPAGRLTVVTRRSAPNRDALQGKESADNWLAGRCTTEPVPMAHELDKRRRSLSALMPHVTAEGLEERTPSTGNYKSRLAALLSFKVPALRTTRSGRASNSHSARASADMPDAFSDHRDLDNSAPPRAFTSGWASPTADPGPSTTPPLSPLKSPRTLLGVTHALRESVRSRLATRKRPKTYHGACDPVYETNDMADYGVDFSAADEMPRHVYPVESVAMAEHAKDSERSRSSGGFRSKFDWRWRRSRARERATQPSSRSPSPPLQPRTGAFSWMRRTPALADFLLPSEKRRSSCEKLSQPPSRPLSGRKIKPEEECTPDKVGWTGLDSAYWHNGCRNADISPVADEADATASRSIASSDIRHCNVAVPEDDILEGDLTTATDMTGDESHAPSSAAVIDAWRTNMDMDDESSIGDEISVVDAISLASDVSYQDYDDLSLGIQIQSRNVMGMVANLLERGALDDSYQSEEQYANSSYIDYDDASYDADGQRVQHIGNSYEATVDYIADVNAAKAASEHASTPAESLDFANPRSSWANPSGSLPQWDGRIR